MNRKLEGKIALAILSLIIGGLIYLFFRPPIYPIIEKLQKIIGLGHLNSFGILTGSIPTLCHTFSFIILTSIFLSDTQICITLNSVFWICIESILEIMQNLTYQNHQQIIISANFILFNDNFRGYFLLGTYDNYDLLSIIAGGILAYCLLTYLREERLCTNI